MNRDTLQAHAKRIGITERALYKRIAKYGEERALAMPRMSKSAAGRKSRKNSKFRFMLPGSPVFEDKTND